MNLLCKAEQMNVSNHKLIMNNKNNLIYLLVFRYNNFKIIKILLIHKYIMTFYNKTEFF